ncbi:hypothetical protein [Streptomyces sp. NBC_00503]|nr:hypothetical protein [Streptomyces sp. NBC_00503]WUD84248.1 hypothetical protein OG490_28880 [Streptomyces sp. NBC_00503]
MRDQRTALQALVDGIQFGVIIAICAVGLASIIGGPRKASCPVSGST